MKKWKYLLCGICILALFAVFAYSSGPGAPRPNPEIPSGPRADLIKIDTMAIFGRLEKSPVEFLHDAHTRSLAENNRDCSACHPAENDRLSLKFKRIKDTDRTTVMNVYHRECISCHGEMRLARRKSGPVECDECHAEKARFASARLPMGFDKSLHYRHLEAQDKKCEQCHHAYDERTKKLFYAKDKEETCRYCHKAETKDNLISMRRASHITCIDCHRNKMAANSNSGPLECAGCHDSAARLEIKKIASVPRMPGKQPDTVLLQRARPADSADNQSANRMPFVPFDHKAHETYTETCRGCHHETLKACNECHTLAGIKQGNEVSLEKAMHQIDSERSCRGCHLFQQNQKNCAGCHVFMSTRLENKDSSCSPCHMRPVPASDAEQENMLAAQMLGSRTPVIGTYDQADIPDAIRLNNLSNQYEAVDFPHRRIVNALAGNIKESKLAANFHTQEGTLCQGCHHRSPVSKKPPRCASCHGKPFDAENPLKPGIVGAYHLQCMGCHKEMGLEKPAGCTGCHKQRQS